MSTSSTPQISPLQPLTAALPTSLALYRQLLWFLQGSEWLVTGVFSSLQRTSRLRFVSVHAILLDNAILAGETLHSTKQTHLSGLAPHGTRFTSAAAALLPRVPQSTMTFVLNSPVLGRRLRVSFTAKVTKAFVAELGTQCWI